MADRNLPAARPELPRQAGSTTEVARVEAVNRRFSLHYAFRAESRADQVDDNEFPVFNSEAEPLLNQVRLALLPEFRKGRREWTGYFFLVAVKVPLAIPARSTLPFMVCPAPSSFPV